jgi:hypothetical protein
MREESQGDLSDPLVRRTMEDDAVRRARWTQASFLAVLYVVMLSSAAVAVFRGFRHLGR